MEGFLMFELLVRKTRSKGKRWERDGRKVLLVVGIAHSKALWHNTSQNLKGSQYVWMKD